MNQYLSIPKPCHEDWSKMIPNSEGKFCGSCSKTVVDFTKMSKEEIHSYFKQKSGDNTCGHFYASQLDEQKKGTASVFKKVNYLATLLLGLFLPLTSCKKQLTGEPAIKDDSKPETELTGDTVYSGSDRQVSPVVKFDTIKTNKTGEVDHLNKRDELIDGTVVVKDK